MGAKLNHPHESIVGAVADYLLGVSLKDIYAKWGVDSDSVYHFIRKCGHFKLRNRTTPYGQILSKVS